MKNRKERRATKSKEVKVENKKPAIEQNDYSKIRVLVAVPSTDSVCADFAMSLAALSNHNTSVRLRMALNNYKTVDIAHSRNMQVAEAQKIKATHILFMDSDMVCPPWACQRLVDVSLKYKHDIVGLTVARRNYPYTQVSKDTEGKTFKIDMLEERNLEEASEMGTGMVLINMDVFNKVEFPYFEPYYKKGKNGKPDPLGRVGEDVSFFEKAREAGYKTMIDIPLSKDTAHIGQIKYDYTSEDFFADAIELRKQRAQEAINEKNKEIKEAKDEKGE